MDEQRHDAPVGWRAAAVAVAGWMLAGTALMAAAFAWALPDTEPELGAYHDPNAAAAPLAALLGWFAGGILGASLALVLARWPRVGRAAAILTGLSLIALVPLATAVGFFAAFGFAPVVLPVVVGWANCATPLRCSGTPGLKADHSRACAPR